MTTAQETRGERVRRLTEEKAHLKTTWEIFESATGTVIETCTGFTRKQLDDRLEALQARTSQILDVNSKGNG